MKILFCNIAYMNHYEGNTERDIIPTGAGKWVQENKDAHEKWNFLNYDGYCYGFVQNGGSFRIERFEGVPSNALSTEDVIIVWCAPKEKNKTVIVGWYEKAKVFREYQESKCTPVSGLERSYFAVAKAEDCYLLPEEARTFEVPRASISGRGKGFGQQNYWYADSEYAKNELIPNVLSYLNEKRENRINRVDSFFKAPDSMSQKLTEEEIEQMNICFDNGEYDRYLPFGYRAFEEKQNADEAFFLGVALQELFQFHDAIKWFKKVVEIEGESWDTIVKFPYLYEQIDENQKAIESAIKILDYPQAKQPDVEDEVKCIIADNNFYLGNIEEAIKWLNKLLDTSQNEALKKHTKLIKKEWEEIL